MTPLTIRNRYQGNNTLIENDFIDYYMVDALGEYVKVYLLLLRHFNNPSATLTIATIADLLKTTERDVLRGLKYWEKKGLLALEYNSSKHVVGIEIGQIFASEEVSTGSALALAENPMLYRESAPKTALPNLNTYKLQKEFKDILYATECYFGKTLTATDLQTISFFVEELHFPADLIEYLIEYCVDNGHKNMRYMKSVAIAWAKKGITNVKQAKADVVSHSDYNKECNAVLKAYGISGRFAGTSEQEYIKKWTKAYGFSIEMIEEACKRTLNSIHQPSFPHTDKILSNWHKEQVHTISDIVRADENYKQRQAKNTPSASKQGITLSSNRFNNFEGRNYNMSELEKQLLRSN